MGGGLEPARGFIPAGGISGRRPWFAVGFRTRCCLSTMRSMVGSVSISPPLFWPRCMGLITSIEALGRARRAGSATAGPTHQFPRLGKQIRGPAKIRLGEAR
jgi:hypothetical protein